MRFHIAAVALDGALWIETDIGLVRFDGKQWLTDRNALKAATVAVAPDGSLWVGTYEGQVFHYEPTLVLVAPAAPLPTALRSSVTPPPLPTQSPSSGAP